MRIIPVIDLIKGEVVQAVRGDRANYRPVQSVLAPGANPVAVARALQDVTGCDEFYIADLDAIMGGQPQWSVVRQIASAVKAKLSVDAAISDAARAVQATDAGAERAIVCSETLQDLDASRAIRSKLPSERLLFSVDVAGGRVRSCAPGLRDADPLSAIELMARDGWSQFIILTLDLVGAGSGPDWSLMKEAAGRFPGLSLIAGGGVSSVRDLCQLASINLSGVLIATSLHRGWITKRDLQTLRPQGS
jgi:phosphoribosylformimino-5-aminoimidazole carboxamide ribotide isomerase